MIRIRRLEVERFKLLHDVSLVFPDRGRFLVQGPNESGKSTLFEAVFFGLFGQALAAESARRLDDLIGYGHDSARVLLEVGLPDGRCMLVERTLRRGKANVWTLTVAGNGALPETVRGNATVNERVTAELGLDADALLNSCFVEQKKLDKLEGLSRARREQSVMRLLNLDRLLEMEEDFRVRAADSAHRDDLAQRVELAELAESLPGLEARRATIAARLARHRALAALAEALALARGADEAQAAAEHAELEEARIGAETGRVGMRRAAAAALVAAADERARAREDEARAAEMAARAAGHAERAASLPGLKARERALARLARHVAWTERLAAQVAQCTAEVAAADAELADRARRAEALNAVRQQRAEAIAAGREAEGWVTELANDVRSFDVAVALRDMVAAGGLAPEGADAETALAAALAGRRAVVTRAAVRVGLAAALAAALAVAAGPSWLLLGAVLAAVGAVALGAAALPGWKAADERVGRAHALAEAGADRARDRAGRAAAARDRLRELNVLVPASPERALEALAEIEERAGGRRRGEVEGALAEARQSAAAAAAEAHALGAREAELVGTFAPGAASALDRHRAAAVAWVARAERALAQRNTSNGALAARLGLREPVDLATISAARGAAQADWAAAAQDGDDGSAATEATNLWRRAAERRAAIAEQLADTVAPHAAADDAAWADAVAPLAAGDDVAWADDALWCAARNIAAGRAADDGADPASLSAATRAAAVRRTEAAAAADARRGAARAAAAAYAALTAPAGYVLPPLADEPALEDLESATVALAMTLPALPAEAPVEVEMELEYASGAVAIARHGVERLEGLLGVPAGDIDPEGARNALAECEHDLAVRERAALLVADAAHDVVRAVLPGTIEYLRRLLPLMTDHRYFDAQLAEDYQIEVWDDRAAAWKRKSIFSGGTKDQFSLALRLAFALATLPEEKGTAPGFLFLDEPMGSFDAERAQALVAILTEGDVAASFDQVFLVSHLPVPAMTFDYVITLADGRVTYTDLPQGEGGGPEG